MASKRRNMLPSTCLLGNAIPSFLRQPKPRCGRYRMACWVVVRLDLRLGEWSCEVHWLGKDRPRAEVDSHGGLVREAWEEIVLSRFERRSPRAHAQITSVFRPMQDCHRQRLDIVFHPPYSTDLTPSDFYLFTNLKEFLGGQRFPNGEEVKETVEKWLSGLERDVFDGGIKNLVLRLKKFIEVEVDFVEK
ncbi:hypothetical protein AAG570_012335 [Ranatra chinensis]|uniref:Transposase n=1 Tax=Ranatra chinensis TaxID=642074 RepID=A0ABD0Z0R3_9HEMI